MWCIRVRPGHRGKGISRALLEGAVAYARSKGAPAVEGYPVDNRGKKVDLTMAYVGTRKLFEDAGFIKAADTSSVSGGFPRGRCGWTCVDALLFVGLLAQSRVESAYFVVARRGKSASARSSSARRLRDFPTLAAT